MGRNQLIDQAKLDNAQIAFSTVFNDAFKVAQEPILDLAMRIDSSTSRHEIKFLGDLPMIEEWKSEVKFSKLDAREVVIKNKKFAAGLRVAMDDIRDDQLGMTMRKVQDLSVRAGQFYADHMVKLLLNGFDGTAFKELGDGKSYDGQFLFSETHQDQGPVQGNLGTAGIGDDSYEAARVSMHSLQDDANQPLEIRPKTLIVGPSKERAALETVKAGTIGQGGAGVDNVFMGTAEVVVSQRLVGAYSNYWFLADTSRPMGPLVWTDRMAPEFIAQNSVDSDSMFEKDEARFKLQLSAGFGYGLWQFVYGSTGAG